MPKVKMMKFEMLALLSDSKSIIDVLQRKGVVELSRVDEAEGFEKLDTSVSISDYERFYEKAVHAGEILQRYCPRKSSLLDSLNGKAELTAADYEKNVKDVDSTMEKCDEIERIDREISQQNAAIVRCKMLIEGLKPWARLDIPMLYSRTESTSIFIGAIQRQVSLDELLAGIAEQAPELDAYEIEIVSASNEQTCIVGICCQEDKEAFLSALRAVGFMKPSEMTRKKPSAVIEDYKHEIGAANMKIEALIKQIKSYGSSRDSIDFVCDYYLIQKEKYDALKNLGLTQNTFFMRGFVPENRADELKQALEARFTVYMSVGEPDEQDDVPVLLKNNSFAAGVEGITQMYSMPGREDVDPNPVMSFFYYALFGIMLSDAGYGLIMVIATFIAKKKFKLSDSMRKSMDMFFYCGIFTVFWGALFGGWFGDAIPVIASNFFGKDIGSIALWFEPVNDAMKLLLYSFLFGIIHLFAGLAVRFYNMCKHRDFFGAVCDVIPVYVFVTGFAIFGASVITDIPDNIKNIGKYLLIAGAALIVLTSGRSSKNIFGKLGGGLYGLYNTASGYLGDVLSYSRLLALCLVTGVIANVVNMLGTMPSNTVVKAIAFVPIFLLGHTLNIGINLIGTYVHTNRLQYVEFFSKFYEGGGRSFTPFTAKNTKHYQLKEETYNG